MLTAAALILRPGTLTAQTQTEPDTVEKIGRGVTLPRVIYSPPAEFSEAARASGYQATSVLTLTVGSDGKPRDIQVKNKIGMGLDEKAVEAVRSWRFTPALKDGKPVAVQIAVEVDFHLYGSPADGFVGLSEKARTGAAKAELDLANFYLQHPGIPQSDQLGLSYLEKAANQGLPRAQFQMGEHLVQKDATSDYAKAYMWFTLAQHGGEKHSDRALKKLMPRMTPDQVQQGQGLVDNWGKASQK
ncbi:MAG: TonB family protein [Candidatus Sulfotelmatobacter sp.]